MINLLYSKFKEFLIGFFAVNILWYIAYLVIDRNVMPNPILVYRAIPQLFQNNIFVHFQRSFYRVSVGLSISMVLGLLIGIIAAGNNFVSKILNPFIYFTYPIPKISLLPVAMLLFGLRDTSKIVMIVLIIVYQIIVVVRDSVRNIPKETYNILNCFGASKYHMFFYVTLPWAVSSILSTMRIALGTAISVLFFTETYGTRHGMGFFIMDAWMRMNYIEMYSGIVILSFVGFLLFMLIDILEDFFSKWKLS